MTKKLKEFVKKNPEPARGTVGVNPMDPWSAKSNLAESMLDQYLLARGINPKFVSTQTKISHAKSSAFLKWKQDHQFEEVQLSEADKADIISLDIPLMIRMLELAREDVKDDMELHKITERLIEIRNKGTLTMADYDFISGIKKLKEELDELAEKKMMDNPCWKGYQAIGMKKKNGKQVPNCVPEETEISEAKKPTPLDQWRKASVEREKKHNDTEKARQETLHQDPSKASMPVANPAKDGMTSAIDRLEKHLNKEEVEQIDEISNDTLKSYINQATSDMKQRKDWSRSKKLTSAPKQGEIALKRAKGIGRAAMKIATENTLDSKAATEAPVGPGEIATEAQKQRSKSARIIKNLYKKKNMKEETYDWEKEDKSVQSYGKKPKLQEPKEGNVVGEKTPDARIVMSGGTTLTGEKRDTVEIDPSMKKRPGPDTFGATGKKASQQ